MIYNYRKIQLIFAIVVFVCVFGCIQPKHAFAQCIDSTSQNAWLEGVYQGSWQSFRTGHHGRMRGRFVQINPNQVRATFTGTFAKIIPFRYATRLNIAHQDANTIVLSGSKRLGPIMGSFQYQAVITPNEVISTYRSRRDFGRWHLRR